MNPFIAIIALGLDAVRIAFSKSKIKETAAAVVVGVGLLAGSTGDVQSACDPPINDVCFHKSGSWASSGYATVWIDFENLPSAKSSQLYEIQWNGLKRFTDSRGRPYFTYDNDSDYGISGGSSFSYSDFWWDPNDSYNNYGCTIYEGHWDYSGGSGEIEWVRGNWVAQVDFYAYQEAAYVNIDNRSSALDFELSQYYCTIEWERELPSFLALHGYTHGYWEWVGGRHVWPRYGGGWFYHGDAGSPRFHYEESCSVDVYPPPHPTNPPARR